MRKLLRTSSGRRFGLFNFFAMLFAVAAVGHSIFVARLFAGKPRASSPPTDAAAIATAAFLRDVTEDSLGIVPSFHSDAAYAINNSAQVVGVDNYIVADSLDSASLDLTRLQLMGINLGKNATEAKALKSMGQAKTWLFATHGQLSVSKSGEILPKTPFIVCWSGSGEDSDSYSINRMDNASPYTAWLAPIERRYFQDMSKVDLTYVAITSQLKDLAQKTGKDDRMVFYFSGHGTAKADSSALNVSGSLSPEQATATAFLLTEEFERAKLRQKLVAGTVTTAQFKAEDEARQKKILAAIQQMPPVQSPIQIFYQPAPTKEPSPAPLWPLVITAAGIIVTASITTFMGWLNWCKHLREIEDLKMKLAQRDEQLEAKSNSPLIVPAYWTIEDGEPVMCSTDGRHKIESVRR